MDNAITSNGTVGLRNDDQVVFRDEILTGYTDFKGKLDMELKANAEGFVRIGYLLKVARDTNILSESGYKNVAEFAFAEYQLTKDIVSRYIAINDKYAENGYSDKLQSRYEGFGVAKLQEMLTLPDAIIEEIEPTLTKREIIDIKKEVAAEEAITPIEVAIEAADPKVMQEEKELTLAQRVWKDIIKSLWDKYNVKDKNSALNRIITTEYPFVTDESFTKPLELALYELIAPSGTATLWARIPGVGRYMVTVKGLDEPINMVNARDGSKINTSFADAVRDIAEIFEGECTAESWERVYGLPNPQYEEKEKVAPVQQAAEVVMPKPGSWTYDQSETKSVQPELENQPEAKNVQTEVNKTQEDNDDEKECSKETADNRRENDEDRKVPEGAEGSGDYANNGRDKEKALGKLETGDRIVNLKDGTKGTMIGHCAGEYKISTENGLILVNENTTTWKKDNSEDAEITDAEYREAAEKKKPDYGPIKPFADDIREKADEIDTTALELICQEYDKDEIKVSVEHIIETAQKIIEASKHYLGVKE